MSTDTDPAPRTSPLRAGFHERLAVIGRHDVPASVVVFLVALPLSLGVAVASGAPVAAGLIAAVVGGVVARLLGGSAVQVSGPTAGLTVVVAERVHQFGWAATCFITVGTGPPERGHSRQVIDEVVGPWRRTGNREDPIVAGIAAYHRGHAHLMRPHLDGLRNRPDADTFFLTCADARIVPNVITNSGPGDLFTVRNVGNLVPAGGSDVSVEAALIYALEKLDVRAVVVCGHSGYGAMEALHREVQTGPGLVDWLAYARPSLDRFRLGHPVAAAFAGFGEVDQLGMVNVALQLERLYAHPVVRYGIEDRGARCRGVGVVLLYRHGKAHRGDRRRDRRVRRCGQPCRRRTGLTAGWCADRCVGR